MSASPPLSGGKQTSGQLVENNAIDTRRASVRPPQLAVSFIPPVEIEDCKILVL